MLPAARRCLPTAAVLLLVSALFGGQNSPRKPQGDKDQPHWAFEMVKMPAVTPVKDPSWVRNPIDSFVLADLETRKTKPAAPADKRTLLRRVYFDLIGLPPTPQEQRAFLDDASPDAYEKVIDDLLARPQYGERWARHWLDVARYAESNGYERDGAKPSAWRYRDYVIDAFNHDKPYDRFILEQIAGDEIDGSAAETMIATTFLRLGTWDDEPADPKVDRYDQLDDVLGTTATAFLGLTLRCARCHNHKFEPLTQRDYYRMLAVFEPLKRPRDARDEHARPVGTAGELEEYANAKGRVDHQVFDLAQKIDAQKAAIRNRLLSDPDPAHPESKRTALSAEVVAAFRTDKAKRTPEQNELVKKHAEQLDKEALAAETAEEKARREEWERAVVEVSQPLTRLPHAYIWYEDSPTAPPTHVLRRGNPEKPAEEVGPGLPAVLVKDEPALPQATAQTTGRRLWLARWIASKDNPLTARVMVNRVWQHHFGEGIVATPNDFGRMGDAPANQALLDWLATDFVDHGWSLKRLHKMILLSNTYRMSASTLPLGCRQRRLEAEPIRDAMLAVSGRLNLQEGGPSVYPPIPREVLEGQSRPGDGWGRSDETQAARRSIYIFVKRSLAVPELDLLDAPDTTSSCEARMVSTTGPQALTFLNGAFAHERAKDFAARLVKDAGEDSEAQVRRAFELALCRPASDEEIKASVTFLEKQQKHIAEDARKEKRDPGDPRRQALESFCLVMLNANEFVYID